MSKIMHRRLSLHQYLVGSGVMNSMCQFLLLDFSTKGKFNVMFSRAYWLWEWLASQPKHIVLLVIFTWARTRFLNVIIYFCVIFLIFFFFRFIFASLKAVVKYYVIKHPRVWPMGVGSEGVWFYIVKNHSHICSVKVWEIFGSVIKTFQITFDKKK